MSLSLLAQYKPVCPQVCWLHANHYVLKSAGSIQTSMSLSLLWFYVRGHPEGFTWVMHEHRKNRIPDEGGLSFEHGILRLLGHPAADVENELGEILG